MKIFHIVEKSLWDQSKKNNTYRPDTLETDGFIHCCKADQIEMVLKLFKDTNHHYLIRIDSNLLNVPIKIEYPREATMSALEFPHIYGELEIRVVEKEFLLKRGSDGHYIVPSDIFS